MASASHADGIPISLFRECVRQKVTLFVGTSCCTELWTWRHKHVAVVFIQEFLYHIPHTDTGHKLFFFHIYQSSTGHQVVCNLLDFFHFFFRRIQSHTSRCGMVLCRIARVELIKYLMDADCAESGSEDTCYLTLIVKALDVMSLPATSPIRTTCNRLECAITFFRRSPFITLIASSQYNGA